MSRAKYSTWVFDRGNKDRLFPISSEECQTKEINNFSSFKFGQTTSGIQNRSAKPLSLFNDVNNSIMYVFNGWKNQMNHKQCHPWLYMNGGGNEWEDLF